jgi:TolB-like protein
MSFVSELRRRQVFRTAAWYGGIAWLAIEVANTVFPQFGLPGWAIRAVIVAAGLGMPIALTLAWFFDVTVDGPRREGDAPPSTAPTQRATVWRSPSFWIALVLGGGLAVSAQQAWHRLVLPANGQPVIAVLPFANLSPDPENGYFADGLHEEVVATLARAGSLRVISGTSVQQYRDPQRVLTEIAGALGADLILEGSVRRSGDDLRLTLQLIDGRTDEHLWAQTYDRKFRDALQLQRTVAEQVVAAIGAKLSPSEQQVIERTALAVPEAYDEYLHALALAQPFAAEAANEPALALLDRSVQLDPGFAPAYALRAKIRIWASGFAGGDPALADAARADIERALEIKPDLPDALVARALYSTYISTDPERALVDLTRALEMVPSDAEAHHASGMTLRRLGRFDEAIKHFNTAALLAPGDERYAFQAVETLSRLGRVVEAEPLRQSLAARYPAHFFPRALKYVNHFQATGDASGWREEHERLAPTMPADFRQILGQAMLLANGDLQGYANSLQAISDEEFVFGASRELNLATTYLALGDERRAQPYLDSVIDRLSTHADDALLVAEGAVALELVGRSDEAVLTADRAVRLRPEQSDALNGSWVAMLRAWVLIHSRVRAEEGYRELGRLLGGIDLQPRWVAATPMWMLLGGDERTQQIIRGRFPQA